VTAGVVDQLPVGGASGNAVSEARSAGQSFADGGSGGGNSIGADATARSLLAALATADPGAAATATAANTIGQGALGEFEGSDHNEAAPAPTGASLPTAAHAAGPAAAGGAAAGGGRLPEADIDRIVEAVEQRLLRQLERRGGRYAGVF
jgi:hypothetical protein